MADAVDWRLTTEIRSARTDTWRHLPTPPRMSTPEMIDPARYRPSKELLDAINTAILLGQPLLITGEPGSGKTEVANFLTYRLGLERPGSRPGEVEYALRFDTKSTTTARDLFYSFDAVSRFHAAQTGDRISAARFINFHAFGRAILDACPLSEVGDLANERYARADSEPKRSVVLLDEVDKAPRDVPNDLLVEIERSQFYVAEINRTFTARPDFRPIVVMTSNSERALPDAFLRRCVFFAMPFPNESALREIVAARVSLFPVSGPLMNVAVGVFAALRQRFLNKPPGTAELIGFAHVLHEYSKSQQQKMEFGPELYGLARAALLKNTDDQARVSDTILSEMMKSERRAA